MTMNESDNESPTQTALTLASGGAASLQPRTLSELVGFAKRVAKSDLYGVKNEDDAFVRLATGMELGFSCIQSMRAIHVIKGKPTLSADAMVALVRRAVPCVYFELDSSSMTSCTYVTKRGDGRGKEVTLTFTIEDAERANLLGQKGQMWEKYPKAMLRARAASALARQEYPEVLLGFYTPEEMQHVDIEVVDPETGEVTQEPETAPTAPVEEYQDAEFEAEAEARHEPEPEAEAEEAEPASEGKAAKPSADWTKANRRLRAVLKSIDKTTTDEVFAAIKRMCSVESLKDIAAADLQRLADKFAKADDLLDACGVMIEAYSIVGE